MARIVGIKWDDDDTARVVRRGRGDCAGIVDRGELYAPRDGQGGEDGLIDDKPDPVAGWYRVRDGRPAIIGLPGGGLYVLE